MDYKPTKDGIKSYIGVRQKSLHLPLDELIYKERNNYWALLLLQKILRSIYPGIHKNFIRIW